MKDVNEELCRQCYAANITRIKEIVEQIGADVNYKEGEPLIYTIRGKGSLEAKQEVLKYLKAHKANLDIREGTALCWAVKEGDINLTRFLVTEGADINQSNGLVVYYATMLENKEILNFLLNNHVKIDKEIFEEIVKQSDTQTKRIIDQCNYIVGRY